MVSLKVESRKKLTIYTLKVEILIHD